MSDERQALEELAAAGIGEGDFDGDDHHVPAEITRLLRDLRNEGKDPYDPQVRAELAEWVAG